MGLESFSVTPERQKRISEFMGSKISSSGEIRGDFWIQIMGDELRALIEFLRSDPELLFDSFVDLCGVDYMARKPRFEVVVHLFSQPHQHQIRIRVGVPDATLTVPSLTPYWRGANWQEREAYDMYGILFEGHPKLERILSAPDVTLFPQRKDYPLKGDRETPEDL
ncbi:MAG TPA: NADH-quinone oxidoreductase subunit C [Bdellovibrionota bacterium]|nr:NADH-quinone oxidoreductase subunit C [Bdellovibrionota bacterium]